MSNSMRNIIVGVRIVLIGIIISGLGSLNGQKMSGLPTLLGLVIIAFAIQWAMFIHSWLTTSEKFFDLTGSVTYIILTVLALIFTQERSVRSYLLAAIVIIWAGRLGSHLFLRIRQTGRDDRFVDILANPARLFLVWSLQGLWITFTALSAWIGITTANTASLGWLSILGVAVWLIGFAIEAIADYQKARFRENPHNNGRFIQSGLWSRSRHPNYFGEIVMWCAVFIIAIPVLHGWQWIAALSPIFVSFLLIKVSGIPMLEKKADSRWGNDVQYQHYKQTTPLIIPKINA
ncbi:DUF1295 domain-containing protein [Arcanobacterium phocae]|uniref:DUF1295 domain-containing protein n=2 Tax=Arcanobacterium phocae TaxID=131112 RepID=UPI001C0EFB8E|nr:DUF1295 domain-containing protein [Arcanobacterium phocae]